MSRYRATLKSAQDEDVRSLYIVNFEAVPFEVLSKAGAEKVMVKNLIHGPTGAERFSLRYFSVEKGGHTPLERHLGEHEVYVMRGKARLMGVSRGQVVGPGDAVFVKSDEIHQFLNIGDEPFEFLSVRGSDHLYSTRG